MSTQTKTESWRPSVPESLRNTKSLRVLAAALRARLDSESKLVLLAYGNALSTKRPDWYAWPGLDRLSLDTGFGASTIQRAQRYLVAQKVLREIKPHPPMQRVPKKGGRPSRCFEVDVERLEALARDVEAEVRPSRGQERIRVRRDKERQREVERVHGRALRDDLARDLRALRRQRDAHGRRFKRSEEEASAAARLDGKAHRLWRRAQARWLEND